MVCRGALHAVYAKKQKGEKWFLLYFSSIRCIYFRTHFKRQIMDSRAAMPGIPRLGLPLEGMGVPIAEERGGGGGMEN